MDEDVLGDPETRERRREDRVMHRAFLDQNIAEARRGLELIGDERTHLELATGIIEADNLVSAAVMLADAVIMLAKTRPATL